jgi:type I restriction enzyme S subunit
MMTGWTTKPISEVIVKSGTIDPSKKPEKPFQYVDVSSISNKTFAIVEPSELLGKDAPSRARRHIKEGDVLFATIRPTLKRIAIVPKELDGQVCSTGYFVFRTKPEVDSRFVDRHGNFPVWRGCRQVNFPPPPPS